MAKEGTCGGPAALACSPELLERVNAEIRERQQYYAYDTYAGRVQKMNTSYYHAVSNHSTSSTTSSTTSSSTDGDRHVIPSYHVGGGAHKVGEKLKTPVSSLRCKRKQPFLQALTPSWKRVRKEEGQRTGEEETETLSE